MAFDIQAAIDAGYTEEEIQVYLREGGGEPPPPASATDLSKVGEPPTPRVAGPGDQPETSWTEFAATYGPPAVGAATTAGALYGSYKLGQNMLGKRMPKIADVAERFVETQSAKSGGTPRPTAPVAPSPSAASRVSPILDQFGRPIQTPPAPTAPVAPSPQSAAQAQNVAREQAIKNFAANKAGIPELKVPVDQVRPVAPTQAPGLGSRIMQGAGQLARGAARFAGPLGVAYSLLAPSNSDTNYPWPMSGPLRGSEINPNTGAPWTREELNAYYQQYSPGQSAPQSAPSGSLFEGAMP